MRTIGGAYPVMPAVGGPILNDPRSYMQIQEQQQQQQQQQCAQQQQQQQHQQMGMFGQQQSFQLGQQQPGMYDQQYQYPFLQQQPPPQQSKSFWVIPCVLCAGAIVAALAASGVYCHFFAPYRVIETQVLIDDNKLDGRDTLNFWNLPAQPSEDLQKECLNDLTDIVEKFGMRWGGVEPANAARHAYKCTKVPGVHEKVPEKMKGVFWMKGNALPEELAILQNGQYFPDERIHVAPLSPYSWAWASDKPKNPPMKGVMYTPENMRMLPFLMPYSLMGSALKFEECPGTPNLPFPFGLPGAACPAGSDDFTYAKLQMHGTGKMNWVSQPEEYTMEEKVGQESQPGSLWKRGIFGGNTLLGQCRCISVGSYDLVKIIDGNGDPIEPYHSQWLEYIGDVPLVFWAGYTDETLEKLWKEDNIEGAQARQLELFCAETTEDPMNMCRDGGITKEEEAKETNF